MEAVAHEDVGPAFHAALIELAPPFIDALDRGAEMPAIADGQRRDALGPRQRRRKPDRAADQFADEMETLDSRRIGDGEHIGDEEVQRPAEIRRRDHRAAIAAHVEGNDRVAVGEGRDPLGPDPGRGADAMMEEDRVAPLFPGHDPIDHLVIKRAVGVLISGMI